MSQHPGAFDHWLKDLTVRMDNWHAWVQHVFLGDSGAFRVAAIIAVVIFILFVVGRLTREWRQT